MARRLVSGNASNDDTMMGTVFMECTPEEAYADIAPPRILTSHTQLTQLPPDVLKKKPRIINLLRNPKDIAVSFYTFMVELTITQYSGKWENFLKPFTDGKCNKKFTLSSTLKLYYPYFVKVYFRLSI